MDREREGVMRIEIEVSERVLAKMMGVSQPYVHRLISYQDSYRIGYHLSNRFGSVKCLILNEETTNQVIGEVIEPVISEVITKEERKEPKEEKKDKKNKEENNIINNIFPEEKKDDSMVDFGEFGEAMSLWLAYKRERGQTYKAIGLKQCFSKLKSLSGGSPAIAMEIVKESVAYNYQGFFALKEREKNEIDRKNISGKKYTKGW